MSEEASDDQRVVSPHISKEHRAPMPEDRDWLPFLWALPTHADLAAASRALQTLIHANIQVLRDNVLGLNDRVSHLESTCDLLQADQTHTSEVAGYQAEYLRGLAIHVDDLDNRGRRNKLRLRESSQVRQHP
ncbi:Hypothetical predicted protein [Pelobates cultripes]|uniref:Uncharacterized protein n=1 Tax=Pelobates cultripes TaxID=61616 RepID=A0AAD1SDJ3_PELCU|nr:Hypothetical predicted protein [Pelobates cultripes]